MPPHQKKLTWGWTDVPNFVIVFVFVYVFVSVIVIVFVFVNFGKKNFDMGLEWCTKVESGAACAFLSNFHAAAAAGSDRTFGLGTIRLKLRLNNELNEVKLNQIKSY